MRSRRYFLLAMAVVTPGLLGAQAESAIVIRGATIHTATGAPFVGSIVLRGGKILAIGATVAAPAGARIIDGTGKVVTPGMIDNHSHIGAKVTDLPGTNPTEFQRNTIGFTYFVITDTRITIEMLDGAGVVEATYELTR